MTNPLAFFAALYLLALKRPHPWLLDELEALLYGWAPEVSA